MSDHDAAPDRVSRETLQALLRNAPTPGASDRNLPIGTAVPVLPLDNADFGAVDLVVLLEQVLAAAGGATSLHLLHASSYLLNVVADAMERRLADPDFNDLNGVAGMLFKTATRALITSISACVRQIDDFVGPLTVIHVESVGGDPASRKGLISDGTLTALGIDIEAFDREFKRRTS
jgi:hypothetical protein